MINPYDLMEQITDLFKNAPEYLHIIALAILFLMPLLNYLREKLRNPIQKNTTQTPGKKTHARYKQNLTIYLIGVIIFIITLINQKNTNPQPKANTEKQKNIICNIDYVIDGDSIQCQNNMQIRLAGIDAPELQTYIGKQARAYVRNIVGTKLSCRILDKDRYGRYVAQCFNHRNDDITAKIVEQGYARNCRGAPSYRKEQKIAQQKKRAMWKNPRNKPKRKSWC